MPEMLTNYSMCDDILDRIQKIYNSCTNEEKQYLAQILHEISTTGRSDTYENIWLMDYKEIPVDIDTFIESDAYLGKTNEQGKSVYPFWRKELREFFSSGNTYHEWVLTGATRIGKTSTAITATCYMLYRLMCLRNPQSFFNVKEVSQFSILFFNLTKELAKGVAFREFNDTLKLSPWFNAHGTFSRSERDFYYKPEGGKVVIDYGSDASHGLGKQCIVGSTLVVTPMGALPIESITGECVEVLQFDSSTGSTYFVKSDIVKTGDVDHTIKIELEDGAIIEGTPDHLVMLIDGSYKALGELSEHDELMDVGKGTGKRHPLNGDINKSVLDCDMDSYLSQGWLLGLKPRKAVSM